MKEEKEYDIKQCKNFTFLFESGKKGVGYEAM